jgi:hypothetical protein
VNVTTGTNQLQELAVLGAATRMAELQREIQGIEQFLRAQRREQKTLALITDTDRRPRRRRTVAHDPAATPSARRMSRAQRKAVSVRMTKYWAARRASRTLAAV